MAMLLIWRGAMLSRGMTAGELVTSIPSCGVAAAAAFRVDC